MISGPNVALGARISPDGRTLAFQAMIGMELFTLSVLILNSE
jgi:hypothetical protein